MSAPKSLIEQSREIEKRMNLIAPAIIEALRPTLVRAGELTARNWRALAADDPETGAPDYRSSITVTGPGETTPAYAADGGKRTAGRLQVLVTAGNEDVRYGHMPEYGTSKMDAQPAKAPAERMARHRIRPMIARAISRATKKFSKP